MAFNSFHYLAFLPVITCAYFLLPHRLLWLFLGSLYFYGIWNPLLLLQLLLITAASWFLAIRIELAVDKPQKRRLLGAGIALLVLNLFVFKYTSFVNESLRSVFGWFDASYPFPVVSLLLPIGISFYTFQLIAYLVDVARGEPAEKRPLVFALFVTFFPKMVAGPIERAKQLLPQLRQPAAFDLGQAVAGLQLLGWGFFKKIVVADRLAPFVARVYDDPQAHSGVGMVLATWLFAFQVYCDFSGYTDIARGSAQILGFRLTENFNRPYFATSIADFWKRWHISLSSFLTDYVFTPMTRQRLVKVKLYRLILVSLFTTFVISGIWHGAEWSFVAWGALHGAYLICSVLTQKLRARSVKAIGLDRFPRLHHALQVAVTFGLVCFSYILFQAKSIEDALYIMTHLFTGWGQAPSEVRDFLGGHWVELSFGVCGIAVVMLVDSVKKGASIGELLAKRPTWVRWSVYQAWALVILLFGAFYDANQRFIYFQF